MCPLHQRNQIREHHVLVDVDRRAQTPSKSVAEPMRFARNPGRKVPTSFNRKRHGGNTSISGVWESSSHVESLLIVQLESRAKLW